EAFYRDSNFSLPDVFGKIRLHQEEDGCQFCHRNIEVISSSHKMKCVSCHGGNSRSRNRRKAHGKLVANPSAPQHAARFCGKCHAGQVAWMERSLMNTARGITSLTRFAWGAHPIPPEDIKGKPGAKTGSPAGGRQTAAAARVQDFLDKVCLRCHLNGEAPRRAGDYRATGCAACHMIYTNDGTTLTRDRAIQRRALGGAASLPDRFRADFTANALRNRRGYPVVHKFSVAIPSVQCEHCHNHNGVGNEFEGLLGLPARPRDSRRVLEADLPVLHGRRHDFLAPDIHRERGMHCIDCHAAAEMKREASGFATMHDAVAIRCEDCHGTQARGPRSKKLSPKNKGAKALVKAARLNPNLRRKMKPDETVLVTAAGVPMPHIQLIKGEWILYSKATGKAHKTPLLIELKQVPAAHQVQSHMDKVECHACHARWSASEWGLHALREQEAGLDLWKDWNFFDPTLQQLQRDALHGRDSGSRGMLLWPTVSSFAGGLRGQWSPGVWYTLASRVEWDGLVLGKNRRGKYSVLKPRYQYFVTDRMQGEGESTWQAQVPESADGRPGLILTPHVPHTIRPQARPCESCHADPLAAGFGESLLQGVRRGQSFQRLWERARRLPQAFQLRQLIADDGQPLQTVLPEGARALTREEGEALGNRSRAYQATRYLDLQARGLNRLLQRESFPFDRDHALALERFGPPTRQEDLYYDKETHEFVSRIPDFRLDASAAAGADLDGETAAPALEGNAEMAPALADPSFLGGPGEGLSPPASGVLPGPEPLPESDGDPTFPPLEDSGPREFSHDQFGP
ncbi:MAG: hypothetical protein ACE5ER_06115, partial [Nitrospinaceae bacterium]